MRKKYMTPRMEIEEFDPMDVIVTSLPGFGAGGGNDDDEYEDGDE